MALAPLTAATKPIKSVGLFDAAGGQTFEQWQKNAQPGDAMPSIAPAQINDSMADMVTKITKADSPLMQAAKTEGLKIANRRGLLNSSIAAGATQRSMLDAALPIASQDATTAANKNAAARAFEYGTAMQDLQIASTERLAAAQRDLDLLMQKNAIAAADRQQVRDIASREGMAAADRALQEKLALKSMGLEEKMQANAITANEKQQVRDIASREGLAAAERNLQTKIQQQEIKYQSTQRELDRSLQSKLASWNLSSSDRNAAAQMLVNMEQLYASNYQSIMANTALSAKQRSAQLASAKALRDRQLNMVEQMYDVDLNWGQSIGSSGGGSTTGGSTKTPTVTTPAATTRAPTTTSTSAAQQAAIKAKQDKAKTAAKTAAPATLPKIGTLGNYLDPTYSGMTR
ncbi:MAG: hypothetical protein KDJ36_09185 [Hyphomicrobiaceae bacterium]|nr:hypothetical protein [Hyphomicrobiaceae bacterium]